METNFIFLALVGIFVAAAAGYLGSFMVIKRMSLVGDALSHVALPGIAIALTLGISPMLGAFVALTLAVLGVWYLGEHSEIYPEALVGVFFTASLSLGVLITPEPELLEALFGNIENINLSEGIVAIILSILIVLATYLISKKLMLGVISVDLAKTSKVNISLTNLIYLFLVGVVVALGVKFVGTLLMGALVIIPAASAKNVSKGLFAYGALSILFGILSAAGGIVASFILHISTGPLVVLVSVVIFILSYILKKNSSVLE
ncbi:metal ABC transporter permease [Patescibacteria group bacterium]